MDIPDVERVVQFAISASLSVLSQRVGRAGHSGQHALGILLAEPSVFQTVKKKKVKTQNVTAATLDLKS